jgi:uncharacterized protein (UPF0333 family)
MRGTSKKGQIHLSFGMIFSIILIIAFIGFAFFAIQKFLGIQSNVQVNQFYNNLQTDVNTVWNSAESTQQKSHNVPSSIAKICFSSSGANDMYVYDSSGKPTGSLNINNLNLPVMTSSGQLCFSAVKGKINLVLEKKFSETLVTITS